MEKITEKSSPYNHLEKKSAAALVALMNKEDQTVGLAVEKCLPRIAQVAECVTEKLKEGGRLFYLGAGTSGRLGVVDASECPPTFGVPHGMVIGLIAGGDSAIRKAVEHAEDDRLLGWKDLQSHHIDSGDFVIGLAASGTTPYVVGALEKCRENNIETACITCNPGSPLAEAAQYPIEVITGPEIVTGSTRLKAGTAQKMVLNMISTAAMVGLGRVKGNKMVDMALSNQKLIERGSRMVQEALGCTLAEAKERLLAAGSVRKAIEANAKSK